MLHVRTNILNQFGGFKNIFDKGLIYQDYKIVPQCPRSETVLSSHELALGYKETKDPSVYVVMKLEESDLD
jgi:isoleucyl-tRNA synthetase